MAWGHCFRRLICTERTGEREGSRAGETQEATLSGGGGGFLGDLDDTETRIWDRRKNSNFALRRESSLSQMLISSTQIRSLLLFAGTYFKRVL